MLVTTIWISSDAEGYVVALIFGPWMLLSLFMHCLALLHILHRLRHFEMPLHRFDQQYMYTSFSTACEDNWLLRPV